MKKYLYLLVCLPFFNLAQASYDTSPASSTIAGGLTTSLSMPVTIACFVKDANHPESVDHIFQLSKDTADNEYLSIETSGTADRYNAFTYDSGGTPAGAIYVAGVGEYDGAWLPIAATFVSTTERNLFVELFANSVTNATANDPSAVLAQVSIGTSPSGGGDIDALFAECAIWDGELSEADITSYLAGNCASGIDASNLRAYYPMDTDGSGTILNEGLDATGDLTVTNATFVTGPEDHPTITCGGATAPRRRHMQ